METKTTYEQFRKAFSIREHPVSGKFGWRRTDGVLDTDEAKFDTEDEAADDRAEYFQTNGDNLPR